MKTKVTFTLIQDYTVTISDDEYDKSDFSCIEEYISYMRESLEIYGEDRLVALESSDCRLVAISNVEDVD